MYSKHALSTTQPSFQVANCPDPESNRGYNLRRIVSYPLNDRSNESEYSDVLKKSKMSFDSRRNEFWKDIRFHCFWEMNNYDLCIYRLSHRKNMFSIEIKLDLKKDLKNWVDGCNKISHGKDWKLGVSPEYQPIVEQLVGSDFEEAGKFMYPVLEGIYEEKKGLITNYKNIIQEKINTHLQEACLAMEDMTGFPLYRKDFILNLTTFPRWPYNKETGEFWSCVFRSPENILWNFLHELQHFQVLHYFKDTPPMSRLTREQFEFLKESLTVILNVECKKFMAREDKWYTLHQDLRRDLLAFWAKESDFNALIAYWCDCVK